MTLVITPQLLVLIACTQILTKGTLFTFPNFLSFNFLVNSFFQRISLGAFLQIESYFELKWIRKNGIANDIIQ